MSLSRGIGVVGATVSLTACGADGGSGPAARDVRGNWTYNASGINAGGPNSCAVSGTTITISSQSGSSFSGVYNLGLVICTGPGLNDTTPVGSGAVVSGVVAGDSVRFNFDNTDWRNFGSIAGSTMSGTVNVRLTIGGSAAVAAGNWTAVKQ